MQKRGGRGDFHKKSAVSVFFRIDFGDLDLVEWLFWRKLFRRKGIAMRTTVACLWLIAGVLTVSTTIFAAPYGGGAGTPEDPYQIWTPAQMNLIGANSGDWGKHFKLMAHIDMSAYTGTQYNIIGSSFAPLPHRRKIMSACLAMSATAAKSAI
jgi:hypothetical protein